MNLSSTKYSTRQLKQAIEWFVRLQSEQCHAEEQLRFETWLAKNANHRAAYAEAERVWGSMDDLKLLPLSSLDAARAAKPRKSTAVQLTSWAFFVFTTTLLVGAWLEYSADTIIYTTQMGGHQRIELADDSYIELNTDTHVSVRISLLQRHVQLSQGEALFTVSHNRFQPFIVDVGDLHIRDVGTRFNIRKHAKGATISVLEGEVELNNGQAVNNEYLSAGSQRSYSAATGLGIHCSQPVRYSAQLHLLIPK